VFDVVPRVPLSNKAFLYQTTLLSIKSLAFTLSTAFTTKSYFSQKVSLKYFSLLGSILNLNGSILILLFIVFADLEAHSDFE
jgi:hypothetical protein